mmetsp:Transcript_11584/g.33347  ORF Transcript_11584/g.33347 Transcript_11584/m.33347 type:complete len:219 (+) Transcript_11584:1578-2234(+)
MHSNPQLVNSGRRGHPKWRAIEFAVPIHADHLADTHPSVRQTGCGRFKTSGYCHAMHFGTHLQFRARRQAVAGPIAACHDRSPQCQLCPPGVGFFRCREEGAIAGPAVRHPPSPLPKARPRISHAALRSRDGKSAEGAGPKEHKLPRGSICSHRSCRRLHGSQLCALHVQLEAIPHRRSAQLPGIPALHHCGDHHRRHQPCHRRANSAILRRNHGISP